jgi:hypothetical protein
MNSQEMLEQLEALAQKMSIKVRYEKCKSRGGLCRLEQEQVLIVRKGLSVPEKVDVLSYGLCKFPLEDYYLMPEVRKLLEEASSSLKDKEMELQGVSDDLEEEFAD